MNRASADIGLIGLAVMGQNLVLNMDDHGYAVAVYNRTAEKTDEFIAGPAAGTSVRGYRDLASLAGALKRPRRVMLLVRAGSAVDQTIVQVLPHLEPGDIVIDGGNSNYEDSIRRAAELGEQDILFVGSGVSGGEEGARHGPSLMPGGDERAWPHIKEIFQAIAAKVEDSSPCCDWVGADGAGHYVKMVHNGIEYGDMQLIAEAYQLLRDVLGLSHDELHDVFAEWNEGKLDSYLIAITRDIMAFRDETGEPLVEKILDAAGQKGTGKWTAVSSLDLGMPVTLVAEAVYARILSALKEERVRASAQLAAPGAAFTGDPAAFMRDVRDALYASKIVAYAQGFMLFRQAAAEFGWNLDYGAIALMWRGGCIIRSAFLGKIKEAFDEDTDLENLLLAPYFRDEISHAQAGWRRAVAQAIELGIPAPAYSSALAFYDGYRSDRLPANIIQAQRDFFGAHTYERLDRPRGEFFHTNWTGRGGETASGSYSA
ncbi:MAG: decarboxylating NADP(+)-dependent phosphogluconate dehydrogenase [Actinomycetia bacterium]|nr:decarboxylating NADP(+)-dependent phosphogluconate dehydrogenase [Actinomycetes bacterium]